MRIAMGIVGVLLVLAIVYFFLPQGLKTTISAVFTGSRTTQQTRQNSPSPSATTTTVAVNTTPAPTTQTSVTPSPSGLAVRRSPSPTARGAVAGTNTATGAATATSTPRAVANAGTALPGTGFENQPVELTIIQTLACVLLGMVGLKLRKHI